MPELTVIVEQCLAPVPGGTGRYAREIAAALAAAPPAGWKVRTVTAYHRDTSAAVIPATDGPQRLPAGHRVLSELWRRGLPPSVRGAAVHATTPLAPKRRHGLVVTVHDAVPWTHPETLTARGVSWHRAMVGRAADTAEAIVVPSLAVADDLAGLFPAAAGRIHVIGLGVTPLPPPPDAAERRRRLGLPDGQGLQNRYVLAIATLEPRKGLDVLVAAMSGAAVGRAQLVVVGPPGWGGVDVAAVAATAGLPPERLHVTGRLDDLDLAAVLAGAAVLAAPSRAEGFGLPVLEAMAAGVPVVCSDAPALVELAAGAAMVVPREDPEALADALGQVLRDDAAAAALVAGGRIRASEFSWAAAGNAVWQLHTGITRRPTDPPAGRPGGGGPAVAEPSAAS
jgi:glycosyltransferase involved in cell wall biosynthesis